MAKLQMDLYWIARASPVSAAEWFKRQPGRFVMWHVKDMHKTSRDYTELGNGTVDLRRRSFPARPARPACSGISSESQRRRTSPVRSTAARMEFAAFISSHSCYLMAEPAIQDGDMPQPVELTVQPDSSSLHRRRSPEDPAYR